MLVDIICVLIVDVQDYSNQTFHVIKTLIVLLLIDWLIADASIYRRLLIIITVFIVQYNVVFSNGGPIHCFVYCAEKE